MLSALLNKYTKDLDLDSVFPSYSTESPNLHVEVLAIPSHRWDVSIKTIDIHDPRDQRKLFAELNRLGAGKPFEWQLPLHSKSLGEAGGNPQVFADVQAGRDEFQVYNATGNQQDWLIAGDMIRFASHTKVYQVLDDCNTDAAGRCTVKVNCAIQEGVSTGTQVLVNNVAHTLIYKPGESQMTFSRVAGDFDAQSYSLKFVEKL